MELKILQDCERLFFKLLDLMKDRSDFKYTLNQHVIRTTISIGSNIAESQNRKNTERNRYLDIAIGSCNELLFQVKLYKINIDEILDLINKIKATCLNLKKYNSSSV